MARRFKTDTQRKAVMAKLKRQASRPVTFAEAAKGKIQVVRKGKYAHVIDGKGNRLYSFSGVTGRYYGATKYHDMLKASGLVKDITNPI